MSYDANSTNRNSMSINDNNRNTVDTHDLRILQGIRYSE